MNRARVSLFTRSAAMLFFVVPAFVMPVRAAQPAAVDTPAKPTEPAAAKQPATKPKPAGLPDLDSLLGTKPETKPADKPGSNPGAKPADDTTRKELDRQLSRQEQADEFASVVKLMEDAADRVEKDRDAGLNTQRVQEDAITRLDRLIKAARQNQSQQQQQQSQQQDQDQKQNQNQRTQSQQQQQQADQAAQQAQSGPGREDASLTAPSAAAPAAWGDLPAHVRDALLQGFSDKFSSMYKSATESYYRKLAEEKKK
ncbi:MAG: hypothetical protein ACK58T_34030 [Phycisphaerae bacterium]